MDVESTREEYEQLVQELEKKYDIVSTVSTAITSNVIYEDRDKMIQLIMDKLQGIF